MNAIKGITSLVQMLELFPDEMSCIKYLRAIRWREGAYCPYCGSKKVYDFSDGKTHKCGDCRQRFSIKVGTIFEDTKVPLRKWFIAIYLITSHSKGISSVQLAKDLGVTQKTAWFMLHRLRHAAKTKSFNAPLKNAVEVDETYIGGKEKNKHAKKRTEGTRGRSTQTKTPVLGMVERGGKVRAMQIRDVTGVNIRKHVLEHVAIGTKVFTDEFRSYLGLSSFYQHTAVSHKEGEYVNGDTHTNTIEGFFALLKRGIIGIYHFVTEKHLDRYLDEFSFRYNLRMEKNGSGFMALLGQCEGRLMWKVLTA